MKQKIIEISKKILIALTPSKKLRKKLKKKLLGRSLFGNFGSCYNEIKLKKLAIEENLKTAETIFLGSSHIAYGINPKYVSKNAYNLGSNSQDLFTSYNLFKYYYNILPELKNVIIGYDVFSRGWSLDKTSAKHICSIYNYLYNVDYESKNYEKNYVSKCIKYEKMKLNNSKNSNGYLYPGAVPMAETKESRAKGHLREWEREISQIPYLEKISLENKKAMQPAGKKYKISVLILPVRPDLKEILPDSKTLFLNDLEKLDLNILNFYDDTDFTFDDFGDYDHLNGNGAKKLSSKIKEALNN